MTNIPILQRLQGGLVLVYEKICAFAYGRNEYEILKITYNENRTNTRLTLLLLFFLFNDIGHEECIMYWEMDKLNVDIEYNKGVLYAKSE